MSRKAIQTTLIVIVLSMLLMLLTVSCDFSSKESDKSGTPEPPENPTGMQFSHSQGFYDKEFDLVLSYADYEDAEIYYTLDGSPPTTDSTLYDKPIEVEMPDYIESKQGGTVSGVNVLSINAIAVIDGEVSEIYTRNYVRGYDVNKRFADGMLVFALNSDPHGLYDHHDGILVAGIDRENWLKENKGSPNPTDEANYNRHGRESERAVHVEMFDSEGNLIISQNAGMRVKGGYSRENNTKSLELYARAEYGGPKNFDYPFFGEVYAEDGSLIESYGRIRLRNGGNDREFAFVRDELSHTLFSQAGHPDTQQHAPAAVFLNGEYYGAAWVKSPRSEEHWENKYGGKSKNFQIIGDDEEGLEGEESAIEDWHEVRELAEGGLTDDVRFSEFCSRVDIDNLLRYYAMQVYINNEDWPANNMEMWRYNLADNETAESEYLDGKWRFIAQDLEFSWNLYWQGDNESGNKVNVDTLKNVTVSGSEHIGKQSLLLPAILERDDMKARFANTLVDLIEGAFHPDNVLSVLNETIRAIMLEYIQTTKTDIIAPGNIWWPNENGTNSSREGIRIFARERAESIYTSVKENLGFDKDSRFKVELEAGGDGLAMMNSRPVQGSAVGNYYKGTEVQITAKPHSGYVVAHWKVNGVTVGSDDSITVSADSDVVLVFGKHSGD